MKTAFFTIVKNEKYFLPIVEKYYAPQFDSFYVLDHESTDGSIEALSPSNKVVTIHNEKVFDHEWLRLQVVYFMQELFDKGYDIVCFAEADEFLVHPQLTLRELSQELYDSGFDAYQASGYNIIDGGEELDDSLPILTQKKNFAPETNHPNYDKILLTKKPLEYNHGFHTVRDVYQYKVCWRDRLYLLHLHAFDDKKFYERIEERNKLASSFSGDGMGIQNQHTDLERHRQWKAQYDSLLEKSVDLNLPPLF